MLSADLDQKNVRGNQNVTMIIILEKPGHVQKVSRESKHKLLTSEKKPKKKSGKKLRKKLGHKLRQTLGE